MVHSFRTKVSIFILTQRRIAWEESHKENLTRAGLPVEDYLADLSGCEKLEPTVGGTIPWGWVLDSITEERVSRAVGNHAFFSLLLTVDMIYSSCFKLLPY